MNTAPTVARAPTTSRRWEVLRSEFLGSGTRPLWLRLLVAVLITFTAVALRHHLMADLGRGIPYISFYPAVMLAALYGGWAAGLLTTTLSAWLAYAWIQQRHLSSAEWVALVVFTLSSLFISALSDALHRANRTLRAAAAARRESEARYQAVLANLYDAVLLTTPDGRVRSANPAACRLFGRIESEICALGRTGLVEMSDPRLGPLLHERARTGCARGVLTLRRADGTQFEGELASSIFTDATGQVCASMVIRDLTAQQRTAAQLEQAAREWQTTFDATRDAVWVLDRDCRILRANRTAELSFARPATEMIGRYCWEIAHGTTAPIPEGPLSRAARSGKRETAELARNGRWYEIIVDPILDGAGHFAGAVHSLADITKRRLAEDALREAERFSRATIDALGAHLCVIDGSGTILTANRAWFEFATANPPAANSTQPGTNYLSICDAATGPEEADARAFASGMRDVLTSAREHFTLEYSCHSPTQKRWFIARVTRFPGTGPVRLVVAHESITERKLAEEALRTAHAGLEALVRERTAALAASNALLDQTGHLARVGGWELRLGTGELTWTGATRLIHEVDADFQPVLATGVSFYALEARPIIAAAVARAVDEGQPFDLELPFVTAKGRHLWVRSLGEAYRENGIIVKIGGAFQDVTPRRLAEDELRRQRDHLEQLLAELTTANERLRELDRLKSEFLSTMSHELRTPLNSIIGFTGILLKGLAGPLNPEQTKQLGMVQTSGRHLLALINDLLDLSLIESGRLELHRERFDFAAIVAEAVTANSPAAHQKGVALHAACNPLALPLVGDRRRSLQILLNLVANAVKFTEHGEVAITARLENSRLVVAVRDTGIGIRPDQLPHLFEAFRQLDASSHRQYEGTGLGLHLTRKLLELLGGTIAVESAAGAGSTFVFTLPLALAGSGTPPAARPAHPPARSSASPP